MDAIRTRFCWGRVVSYSVVTTFFGLTYWTQHYHQSPSSLQIKNSLWHYLLALPTQYHRPLIAPRIQTDNKRYIELRALLPSSEEEGQDVNDPP